MTILKPLVPYAMLIVAMLVMLTPVYQKVKSERDSIRQELSLTQDSLHREQAARAETQVKLLALENRDNVVMARYERALREHEAKIDSMKGAIGTMTNTQQRAYLKDKIQAIPRLVREELTAPSRYVTPVSYWRADPVPGLTCYDSTGVANIAAAVAERDCLRETGSLSAEAYERLRTRFSEYYQAVDYVGDMRWTRSKKKAIKRLNANTVVPP